MAEVHADIRAETREGITNEYGPYHLAMEIPGEALKEERFIFSAAPIKHLQPKGPYEAVQDILFYLSDEIGADFWQGEIESGSSQEWLEYALPFISRESDSD